MCAHRHGCSHNDERAQMCGRMYASMAACIQRSVLNSHQHAHGFVMHGRSDQLTDNLTGPAQVSVMGQAIAILYF